MKKESFSMKRASTLLQWAKVYRLYLSAFPACERKPFAIIRRMHREGKTDVWYLEEQGCFAGFATTINSDELILLDYLALKAAMRGRGVGSACLAEMKRCYRGKGLFVEIESVYEQAGNKEERLRRKRFYEKNGMEPMNVMASVFGTPMELLGWECRLDFSAYHAFYRDHYSRMAADHIKYLPHPEENGGKK